MKITLFAAYSCVCGMGDFAHCELLVTLLWLPGQISLIQRGGPDMPSWQIWGL